MVTGFSYAVNKAKKRLKNREMGNIRGTAPKNCSLGGSNAALFYA